MDEYKPYKEVSATVETAASLKGTIGTNGYHGGDSSHGGFARLAFKMDGGTMEVFTTDNKQTINIVFGGDCELYNLYYILKILSDELGRMLDEHPDPQMLNYIKYDHIEIQPDNGGYKTLQDVAMYGIPKDFNIDELPSN